VSFQDKDKRTTTDGQPPRPGFEDSSAPAPVDASGQHEAYWVLTAEERAKGFVRPVRRSYQHVGQRPAHPVRPLNDEEKNHRELDKKFGYVAFEEYAQPEGAVTGRYWTQAQLDARACGTVTTMGLAIAETYARDPKFYGATFCCGCGKHLPVAEFVWDGTDERVGS
jgi:hypothetical protein